jgi:hypothetical protein
MTDAGLPLPPRVIHTPTVRPGANDLDPHAVVDRFNQIASDSNAATRQWADRVAQAAGWRNRLTPPQFDRSGPGLLTSPEEEIYGSMGVDINKTGLGDMLKSIGAGMGYIFKHPWTAFRDSQMVAAIEAAQAQFLRDYAGTLTFMSEELGTAAQSLGAISTLFEKADLGRGRLDDLMRRKAECGNDAYRALGDALDQETDPDRRAALEHMKARFDDWMGQRDARVAAEAPAISGLGDRLQAVTDAISQQRDAIAQARLSMGPSNTTSGGRIVDSTHIRPEAVDYARGLRNVLAGSRARLDAGMSGG